MKIYFSLSILGALALTSPLRAQDATKLLANSPAPQIITRDVGGSPVQVPNGKSGFVLLSFFRGSGCPICRLRFHELEEHADELKAHHVDSIAIYEDKEEFLRQYTRGVPSFTR